MDATCRSLPSSAANVVGADDEARRFLETYPDTATADLFVVDPHGIARGKRVPARSLRKAFSTGLAMPRSLMALDVWGNDVPAAGYAPETGDGDALCRAVAGSLGPMTWARHSSAQLMLSMHEPDGSPFFGDPRHVLARIVDRLSALGLTPVVATELEFYLVEPTGGQDDGPAPPRQPVTGRRPSDPCVLSLDELEGLDAVFADIEAAALAQGIPTDALTAEHGAGQFEINLCHHSDALLAADQAVLFKRAIKGCARAHGLVASFMAKPFGQTAGSGMHVHLSLLDRAGRNVFDDGAAGSGVLRHAIAGLCATMPQFMVIFAPNRNSFRRLRPGAFAPTAATWGYENRTVAVRVPYAGGPSRRLEHRVAGADANPYLVLAAILAGVLHGVEEKLEPTAPLSGCAYDAGERPLPASLPEALHLLERSDLVLNHFGAEMVRILAATKWQEYRRLEAIVPAAEHAAYLRSV